MLLMLPGLAPVLAGCWPGRSYPRCPWSIPHRLPETAIACHDCQPDRVKPPAFPPIVPIGLALARRLILAQNRLTKIGL